MALWLMTLQEEDDEKRATNAASNMYCKNNSVAIFFIF